MKVLLDLFSERFPGASKSTLRKKLAHSEVTINGKKIVSASHPIHEDDNVHIEPKKPLLANRIPILHQDDQLIVLDKPAGLLSVNTPRITDSLHTLLKRNLEAPVIYPVHRLDRDTSGLIVFALTTKARDELKKQLEKRTMKRVYEAIVTGSLSKKKDTISLKLEDDPSFTMRVSKRGKEAVTHYEVLRKSGENTIVRCTLETGRKNQIRVSFAHIGHPILGDTKYGNKDSGKRLYLHAKELTFTHPVSGKEMTFSAKTPWE